MDFARISSEIETCQRHLDRIAKIPDLPAEELVQIDAFLTRYLLISIYAEFELSIDQMVRDRAAHVADEAVQGFVVNAAAFLLRRIRVSDLAGFLGRFSEACKLQFRAEISDEALVCYNNVLDNRHETAHASGSLMSFKDLCEGFPKSVAVLDAFERALVASIP